MAEPYLINTDKLSIRIAFFNYGGVQPETFDSLVRELWTAANVGVTINIHRVSNDALISRSRSVAATQFLEKDDADVLFMLDHDIEWPIGGMLIDTARKARDNRAVVGGLYCVRDFQAGFASRFADETSEFHLGQDGLHEAKALATGFMAIERSALRRVLSAHLDSDNPDMKITKCFGFGEPFYDFFRCYAAAVDDPDEPEYLSEDYAFTLRAKNADVKTYLYEKPYLIHHGDYGFKPSDALRPGAVHEVSDDDA